MTDFSSGFASTNPETRIIGGSPRLSSAEEAALNILLHRAAGDAQGMPLYKIGWAIEDNGKRKIPICFHECQASYHLLSWEPPTAALLSFQRDFQEDFSKGTYACVMHFIDPQTKRAFNPTTTLMEAILPRLKAMRELAEAGRRGYEATVQKLRSDKISAEKERQKREEKKWDKHADAVLAEASDKASKLTKRLEIETRQDPGEQPEKFAFTTRAPKTV